MSKSTCERMVRRADRPPARERSCEEVRGMVCLFIGLSAFATVDDLASVLRVGTRLYSAGEKFKVCQSA